MLVNENSPVVAVYMIIYNPQKCIEQASRIYNKSKTVFNYSKKI